jgi:type I restriction enzyme, S subunit
MMRTVLLGDVIELAYGKSLPQRSRVSGRFPVFGSNGQVDTHNKSLVGGPGIIVGRKGSVGEVIWSKQDFWPIDTTYYVRLKNPDDDLRYWYYVLKTLGLNKLNSHSAIPGLNRDVAYIKQVPLRSTLEQEKIANILGSLDEKIELNRRMNETLEQLGQALFRYYFVDNPEAKNWKKRSLGEFFPVKTGKKDANFSTKDGKFPFFTCAQTISRAPSYSFDGSAILVAGNGDFNIKYYTGRFEAYQRTYVLIPHHEELLGFLYFLMKKDLSLITGGSRGSVIKFITKGMIENYRVELPDDNDLAAFAPIFSELLYLISHNNEQIQTLVALRDSLLPQLMTGKVEVK